MKIWLYCSYSGSPTGFRLGYIDEDDSSKTINEGNPHKLLDRCFTYQGIAKSYGKIPGTDTYIYYRPIKRQKDDTIFINIGFETDSSSEFEHIFSYFEQYNTTQTYDNRKRKEQRLRSEEEESLFNKLRPIIIEKQDDLEFGIVVDCSHMESLLNEIKEFPCVEIIDEGFFLQSTSEMEENIFASNVHLTSILGSEYSLTLKKSDGSGENLFMVIQLPASYDLERSRLLSESQKKTKSSGMILSILLMAVVILILIWLLLEKQ